MNIRRYEDRDFERVRQIALSSFCLDSFHKDPFFTREAADRIIWEIWTMPACDGSRNRCFVTEYEGIVTGFLLFGGMKELGRLYGRKIGTIIILAVDEKYRNSTQKYGSSLVRFMAGFFQKAGAGIITVGTDADNIPALKCYVSSGFQPVLRWSIFRHYSQDVISREEPLQVIEDRPEKSLIDKYFNRPVSFLSDPELTEDFRLKVRNYYLSNLADEIGSGGLLSLQVPGSGYVIFQEEKAVSEISGKKIWRMNDLLAQPENRKVCLNQALRYLAEKKGAQLVECFTETGDKTMISALEACGFRKVHDAVTLHHKIQDELK